MLFCQNRQQENKNNLFNNEKAQISFKLNIA